MSDKDNKIKELYTIAELAYINKFKIKCKRIDELFPIDWYKYNDYKKKIEIIYDSIRNNILIENSELYKNYKGKTKHLSNN